MLKSQRTVKRTWLFGTLIGVPVYFAFMMIIMLVGSVLVLNGSITVGTASIALLLFMMVASYLGCLLAGTVSDNNKFYGCAAVLAISFLFRMILTLFTYDGHISGTLINTIPEIVGCALALLTILKKGSKIKRKKIKKRYL